MQRSSVAAQLMLGTLLAVEACDGSRAHVLGGADAGAGADTAGPGAVDGPGMAGPGIPVFACASMDTLTFDLPCRVGVPLGNVGSTSAVECSAHSATSAGKWSFVADLSFIAAHLNQPIDLSSFPPPPPGNGGFSLGARGSVEFSAADVAARTFTGRFVEVALFVVGQSNEVCRGTNSLLWAVAGGFM
jgi:hypothetical protein